MVYICISTSIYATKIINLFHNCRFAMMWQPNLSDLIGSYIIVYADLSYRNFK